MSTCDKHSITFLFFEKFKLLSCFHRLCKHCKQPYTPSDPDLRSLGLTPESLEGATVYRPGGCEECSQSGYRGRVGVFELFALDSTLREMCFRGASSVRIRVQAKISGGLVSLMDDGVRKTLPIWSRK